MSDEATVIETRSTQDIGPYDPLRRNFVAECLAHVHRIAADACDAIVSGDDNLFEIQVDLMRLTMREVIRTFREMQRGQL
jgi:hypothetical protein